MSTRSLALVYDVSRAHEGLYDVLSGTAQRVLDPILEEVRRAEEIGFDALFLFDTTAFHENSKSDRPGFLEPIVLVTALAQATDTIGLLPTLSTTYWDPYNLARQLASLHLISGGRLAWNAVTSFTGEWNYSLDALPSPEERYRRAGEFLETVHSLLTSWSTSAVRERDPAGDRTEIRAIDHVGEFFRVRGPIDVPRYPHDLPVQFQAGGSDLGIAFGAQYAEAIYTANPTDSQDLWFRDELNTLASAAGRSRTPLIFQTLGAQVHPTRARADAARRTHEQQVDVAAGRAYLTDHAGIPGLDSLADDEKIPASIWPDERTLGRRAGRHRVFRRYAEEFDPTVRELVVFADAGGHWREWGTVTDVADAIEQRFRRGSLDILGLSGRDRDQRDVVFEVLVPELKRRGIVTERRADQVTLRQRLGL